VSTSKGTSFTCGGGEGGSNGHRGKLLRKGSFSSVEETGPQHLQEQKTFDERRVLGKEKKAI